MTRLRIAEDLSLPVEAATQTFLIVGKRGSGKTSTAVRLAEQLIKADVPIVVIDPVDRWHGLKSSRDGKEPGLSVYVFGGEYADLPLEPGAGVVIADTLIEHRISAVLSVKHLSGRERGQFVSDLAGRLFQRNKEPLHIILEEAHEVAPQQPFKGEEEMLGRVTRLWKLGRSSGLGGSAITQRPASLSKNITTQAEILIVHRTLGPQDVAAVREWIRYHGERDDILGELATLKTGEAFIWAPDFPEGKPIGLKRVRILDRETFDSSATPKVGQRAVEPKALAPVDLDRLRARMSATIERAKAEDPRELRRRIAELERDLKHRKTVVEPPARPIERIKEKRIEVPVLKDAEYRRVERILAQITALVDKLGGAQVAIGAEGSRLSSALAVRLDSAKAVPYVSPPMEAVRQQQRAGSATEKVSRRTEPAEGFTDPQQHILDTVLMLEVRGIRPSREGIARWLAIHPNGGRYLSNLATLRAERYLDGLALTDLGRQTAKATDTGTEAALAALKDDAQRRVLEVILKAHPEPLSRDELAARLGIHPNGGRYLSTLAWLRTMAVISERGPIIATDGVFR